MSASRTGPGRQQGAALDRGAEARSTAIAAQSESMLEIIEFVVGGERYALALEAVVEVVPVSTEGRAATRQGSEVAVVDGHSLLGSSAHPRSERLHGLVVRSGSSDAILAVDRVLGIRDVASRCIVAPPDRFSQRTVALVSGIVPGADGMIVLLDPAAIAAAGDRVGH